MKLSTLVPALLALVSTTLAVELTPYQRCPPPTIGYIPASLTNKSLVYASISYTSSSLKHYKNENKNTWTVHPSGDLFPVMSQSVLAIIKCGLPDKTIKAATVKLNELKKVVEDTSRDRDERQMAALYNWNNFFTAGSNWDFNPYDDPPRSKDPFEPVIPH